MNTLTSTDPPPGRTAWLWWACLLVAILGLLVALVAELGAGSLRATLTGDQAVLELRGRAAWAGQLWVGPYSRFGWSHPGPLLFYLLWPGYLLSGGASSSLYLTAGLLNLLSALALLWLGARAFADPRVRAAGLLLFGLLLLFLVDLLLPTAFTAIWNPLVTLLPYALFVLLCALLAGGRPSALPPALFLHALLVQSHLAYGLTASVALLAALILALRSPSTSRAEEPRWRPRRWLSLNALLALLLWLPPLWDQLRGSHNLSSLWRFFLSSEHQGLSPAQGLRHAVEQLSRPLLPEVMFTRLAPLALASAAALLLALVAALLLGYRRARRLDLTLPAALCLLCLVQLAAALLSALSLDDPQILHPTYWFGVLALLSWFAAAAALLPERRLALSGAWRWRTPATTAALLALLTSLQLQALRDGYRWLAGPGQDEARLATRLSERIAPVAAGEAPPALLIRSHDAWRIYAGVILQLSKRGLNPVLDPGWRFMFGPGYAYSLGTERPLEFSQQRRQDQLQLATAGDLHVYLTGGARRANPPDPEARLLTGQRVTLRDAAGQNPPAPGEGQPWDSPGVSIPSGADAALLYELPGGVLRAVTITADNNDQYLLAGAATRTSRFMPLGAVPGVPAPGLRPRTLRLASPAAWRFLQVTASGGDGRYSVAALRPELGAWGLSLLRWRGLQGEPGDLVSGRPPAVGSPISHPRVVRLAGERAAVVFGLPLAPVAGVAVLAVGNDSYLVEGTYDGRSFTPLGVIPAVPAFGLRWRHFYFNDARLWQAIRISPHRGDGHYALGQVEPLTVPGQVLAPGSAFSRSSLGRGWSGPEHSRLSTWSWIEGTEATLQLQPRPDQAHDLLLLASPLRAEGKTQTLEVWAGDMRLARFEMHPHLFTYHLLLPAALARSPLTLTLRFAYAAAPPAASPPGDQRRLAASFSQIQLRPLEL